MDEPSRHLPDRSDGAASGPSSPPSMRWAGRVSLAATLAAVVLSFVWFARRGVGPGALVAAAWPLWLLTAAGVAAVAGGGWLLGRILGGRPRPPSSPS